MKKILALALTLMMMFTLVACGGDEPAPAPQAGGTEAAATIGNPDDVYYMISYLSTLEFWDDCYEGFKAGAELWGAKTEYTGAEGVDAAAQITILEQVIATNPTGIAITVCDATALDDTINKAIDQGIEVVCFDAASTTSKSYATLQTGNESAGAALAKLAAEELGNQGDCAVLFSVGSPTHEARAAGIRNEITSRGMSIADVNFDGEQTDAAAQAASVIQSNPDLKAIFVVNANGALGAAAAVREAGKQGEILVVGFDTDGGMYEAIESGEIFATARQGCYNMGYWSFQFLFSVANDLVNPVEGWREAGLSPLPPHVDTGVNVVTKDNVAVFNK